MKADELVKVYPFQVPCPDYACQARAGQYCKRPSGHRGPAIRPHAARMDAAEAHLARRARLSAGALDILTLLADARRAEARTKPQFMNRTKSMLMKGLLVEEDGQLWVTDDGIAVLHHHKRVKHRP